MTSAVREGEQSLVMLPRISIIGALGVTIVGLVVMAALLAPVLSPHAPSKIVGMPFEAPGQFLLGTDVVGRDLLSRLLYGAQFTVLVTFVATTLGFVLGVIWGFAAAELGGVVDDITDFAVNILLSFPPLMLGLLIVAALSSSLTVLIAIIAFIQLPRVVRVARSVAQNVTALQFVEAARARGHGLISIMLTEILPNSWRALGVEYGLRLTYSTLFISSLSFLGLGIQPPDADWGLLVRENLGSLQEDLYLPALLPAVAIGIFGIGLNLIVDWLGNEETLTIPEDLK
jgi:peptide/nickel transport system permease protein